MTMWKVEYFGLGDIEPIHSWTVTCDTFVEARAVTIGRLGKALGSVVILIGALRNCKHAVYLRGNKVGSVKFTEAN